MSIISDIENLVLDRLEEDRTTPKFWSVQREIRVFIVEAMREATLITGEPQLRSGVLTTLTANTRLFSLPSDCVALLRVEGPGILLKRFLWDMDQVDPDWETRTGDKPDSWFPFGLTKFGIVPKLTADASAILTYIALPVASARPYTGAETVPFQQEYLEGLQEAAAHYARLKEGGPDFAQSLKQYERFLSRMEELSKLGTRQGTLRFTKAVGAPAKVSEVEAR